MLAEDGDGRVRRYRITRSDALRGRANLLLPRESPPCWYTVRAAEGKPHPWREFHFRAESSPRTERLSGTAVVRPRTREGILADRLLTAALRSVYPEGAIHHIDSS